MLHTNLQKKWTSLVSCKGVMLLHATVLLHIARVIQKEIREFNMEIFPHSPFLPDHAPSVYHHLRLLQYLLRGECKTVH